MIEAKSVIDSKIFLFQSVNSNKFGTLWPRLWARKGLLIGLKSFLYGYLGLFISALVIDKCNLQYRWLVYQTLTLVLI